MDPGPIVAVGGPTLLALLLWLWWRARQKDEAREDPLPRRLLTETAKSLGVPTERTVTKLDVETRKPVQVRERVDPAEHWQLLEDGRWRVSGWNPDVFRASDPGHRAKLEAAAAYVLGCKARKEEIRGHWDGHYGQAFLEVVPAPVLPTVAPTRLLTEHPPLPATKLPFGVTDKGILSVPLDAHSRLAVWDVLVAPHMLMTGATGSRKTGTARAIVVAALHAGWEVVILNGKGGSDWTAFRGQRGVRGVYNKKPEIVAQVIELEAEAQRRYDDDELAADAGLPRPKHRRLLIVFDERMDVSDGLTDKKERDAFTIAYSSILRKARGARMHDLDITQRADIVGSAGKSFSGEARDNLPARLALGPHRQEASTMTLGDANLGAKIEKIPGRGIFMVGSAEEGGAWQHVQCVTLPDPRDEDAPELARRDAERLLS
jgi:hypothetical protein